MKLVHNSIWCLALMTSLVLAGAANCPVAAAASQTSTRDKFDEANQACADNEWEEARGLYRELVEEQVADAVLFAKLGYTYTKLGQPGHAVLMYEKALRLEPRHAEVIDNLRQIEPPGNRQRPFILLAPFVSLRDYLSLDEWTWLMAGGWCLLALTITGACLLKSRIARRIFKRLAWGAAIVLLFVSGMLAARCWSDEYARQGIVLESLVSRFGPGLQYQAHLELPAGRRVRVNAIDGQWAEISVPGASQFTYIESSHLEKI